MFAGKMLWGSCDLNWIVNGRQKQSSSLSTSAVLAKRTSIEAEERMLCVAHRSKARFSARKAKRIKYQRQALAASYAIRYEEWMSGM